MKREKNYNPSAIIGGHGVRGVSRQPICAPYNGRLIGHAPGADKRPI